MDSNAEHAQHGDLIEVTDPQRIDYGKRMQVVSSNANVIVVLDNRVRITLAHANYKVVRRCGRPATIDSAKPPKVTKAPAVTPIAPTELYNVPVTRKLEPIVTDADVANLEQAIRATNEAIQLQTSLPAEMLAPLIASPEQAMQAAVDTVRRTDDAFQASQQWNKTHTREPEASAEHRANSAEADKAGPGTPETAHEPYASVHRDIAPGIGVREFVDPEAARRQYEADLLIRSPFIGMDRASEPDRTVLFSSGRRAGKTSAARKHNHYFKDVTQFDSVDVYRVLERFGVTDPCLQHAIKKLLVAGGRGVKDIGRDVQEAIDTLERFKDMRAEETA